VARPPVNVVFILWLRQFELGERLALAKDHNHRLIGEAIPQPP
jgi:hypothetical protein